MEIYSVDPIGEGSPQRGRPKGAVAKIREVHHTVARLYARGFKPPEIGAKINRTGATVRNWLNNPAMAELVAQYAGEHAIEITNELEYRTKLLLEAGTLSLESVVEQLKEDPSTVPIAQRLKLIDTMNDRTGLARQETKVNLNLDLGTRLDQAIERSRAAQEQPSNVVKLRRV